MLLVVSRIDFRGQVSAPFAPLVSRVGFEPTTSGVKTQHPRPLDQRDKSGISAGRFSYTITDTAAATTAAVATEEATASAS